MFFYLFLFALSLNLIFLTIITRLVIKTKKAKAAKKELTKDASELLSDLLSGGAITVVKVVDPSSIFLHSPRGM